MLIRSMCLALAAMSFALPALAQVGPAFTYQGEVRDGGSPLSGAVDLRFRLYDAPAGGAQIGPTLQALNVPTAEGRFGAQLDFGVDAFAGQRRWLELDVARAGTGAYSTLAPRQELTAVPYAAYAASIPPQYATFTSSGGAAVFNSGNVGIGTASPSAGLHVARVDPSGLALNVDDRLYVSGPQAFVGVNRTTRVSAAETFGLRNTPAQTGYTGMYIDSTSTTGQPFYGYRTPGMTGWTTMNNTGLWSVYLAGAPRLNVNAAGDVTAATFAGSGPGLVNLNASNLATGTVADARLPATLPRLASSNTFTGAANRFAEVNVDAADSNPGSWTSGVLRVGGGASGEGLASNRASNAGLNRYGLDFYTGSERRLSLTLGGDVGIGTATPAGFLHARAPAGEYYPINSMIFTGFIIPMYQGDAPHWQSFRARTEGYVPRIHLLTALPSGGGPFFGTVNIRVHEGEGAAGPVVATGTQNVILFEPTLDVAVNLDAAFPILVGRTYTVEVYLSNATNGLGWVVDSFGDMLPEGSADTPGSSRDFALAVAVQRGASDAIVVSRGGMVGINQPDPRFQLDVAGTVSCWRLMTSSEFVASSARFKSHISDFAGAGAVADALRPVRYLKAPHGDPEIGLIAEEVAAILPEAVALDEQGRPAGVSYSQVAVVALAALKEQRARTAALEARVADLERLVAARTPAADR